MQNVHCLGQPLSVTIFIRRLLCHDPGAVHKEPEYLKISPGGKVPCMVDPDGPGGTPVHLMESAAILEYIGEKTGMFVNGVELANYKSRDGLYYGELDEILNNCARVSGASADTTAKIPPKIATALQIDL